MDPNSSHAKKMPIAVAGCRISFSRSVSTRTLLPAIVAVVVVDVVTLVNVYLVCPLTIWAALLFACGLFFGDAPWLNSWNGKKILQPRQLTKQTNRRTTTTTNKHCRQPVAVVVAVWAASLWRKLGKQATKAKKKKREREKNLCLL